MEDNIYRLVFSRNGNIMLETYPLEVVLKTF